MLFPPSRSWNESHALAKFALFGSWPCFNLASRRAFSRALLCNRCITLASRKSVCQAGVCVIGGNDVTLEDRWIRSEIRLPRDFPATNSKTHLLSCRFFSLSLFLLDLWRLGGSTGLVSTDKYLLKTSIVFMVYVKVRIHNSTV